MPHATGPFDVTITKQETAPDAAVGRNLLYKEFHGDLEAVAHGEMLAAFEPLTGAGVYVAIDRVSGTLHGRGGSFVLQHSGTMDRGVPRLVVSVVPDSGTDELTGLAGTMRIDIESGAHSYVFDYTLGGSP